MNMDALMAAAGQGGLGELGALMGGAGMPGGQPQLPASLMASTAPDNDALLQKVMETMMKLAYADSELTGNQERMIDRIRTLQPMEDYSQFLRMQAAQLLSLTVQIRMMKVESKEQLDEVEQLIKQDYSKMWQLLDFELESDAPPLLSFQIDTTRVDCAKTLQDPEKLNDVLGRLLKSQHDYAKGAAVSVAPILGRWSDMLRVADQVAAGVPGVPDTEVALQHIYKSFPGLPDIASLYRFAREDGLAKLAPLPLDHVKFGDANTNKITVWLQSKQAYGKAAEDKETTAAVIGEEEDVPVPPDQVFRMMGGMALMKAFSHDNFPVVGYVRRFVVPEGSAAAAGAGAEESESGSAGSSSDGAAAAAAKASDGTVAAVDGDEASVHDPLDVSDIAPGTAVELLRLRGSTEGPADPEEYSRLERAQEQAQQRGTKPPELPPKMKTLKETQEFRLRRATDFQGYEGTFRLTQESGVLDGSPPPEEDKLVLLFRIKIETGELISLDYLYADGSGGSSSTSAAGSSPAADSTAAVAAEMAPLTSAELDKALDAATQAAKADASASAAATEAPIESLVDGLDLD